MSKMIILANRLPISVSKQGKSYSLKESVGGLATGLNQALSDRNVQWVGWPGVNTNHPEDIPQKIHDQLRNRSIHPIWMSANDFKGFYDTLSNGALWPLYHYLIEQIPLQIGGWEDYHRVNQLFADRACQLHQPGDMIWVQDYQLQLVPKMIRRKIPDATIGFFLHIPFPSEEVFRIFPWKSEILEGLLGANLIGFHTHSYERNFSLAVLRTLGLSSEHGQYILDAHQVHTGVFPLGIDLQRFTYPDDLGGELSDALVQLRKTEPEQRIVLAIDRLDYTKGLPHRLRAFEIFLQNYPEWQGKVSLIQIAAPSRDKVQAYASYRRQVEQMVGHINGLYGRPGYQPVQYINRAYPLDEVIKLYALADVMMVTPLRDGMNLVAKEFISTRRDLSGVLMLSEFAGASSELSHALMVNPYDPVATAVTLDQALRMPPSEQRMRMSSLRDRVASYDAHTWTQDFVIKLGQSAKESIQIQYSDPIHLAKELRNRSDHYHIFSDYDGTLVPIAASPEDAQPDSELKALLENRILNSRHSFTIVTGRDRHTISRWIGHSQLCIYAEHGAVNWDCQTGEWQSDVSDTEIDHWKSHLRPTLDQFLRMTPGAKLEDKPTGFSWHYRLADPEHGERMAAELRLYLLSTATNLGAEVLGGKKVIEVRAQGVNKGKAIRDFFRQHPGNIALIAIGDDTTDEDMFRCVGEHGVSIGVGSTVNDVQYRLRSYLDVRRFLDEINQSS